MAHFVFWGFFNGLFYFLPHSLKIYVKNMQLRKETENPLEQILCLLFNLVRMMFFKMQVTGGKKKKKKWVGVFFELYPLGFISLLNNLAPSFFVNNILACFSIIKGITWSLKSGSKFCDSYVTKEWVRNGRSHCSLLRRKIHNYFFLKVHGFYYFGSQYNLTEMSWIPG